MRRCSILRFACATGLAACSGAWQQLAAAPASAQFTLDSQQSQLSVEASYLFFSDEDSNTLAGTIDVVFDFGVTGFGDSAELTVTGAAIAPQGDYELTLGFPPSVGANIVASDLLADVTTPAPPGTMTRTPALSLIYQFAVSQFELSVNQGTVTITGIVNETRNLAEEPIAGSLSSGTRSITFLTAGETGPYTRLNATLNLPINVTDVVEIEGGGEVTITATGALVANSSFYAALSGVPGDFNDDGKVDGADLSAWKTGYGTVNLDSDADSDDDVDGADFLIWQRNVGIAPPIPAVASSTTPEPSTVALGAIAAALFASAHLRTAWRFG